MQKKYFNNLITSTLIISTILMPLSFLPKKAEAQGYSAYIGGIAPMVASLPQCKEKLKSGVKTLFDGIPDVFGKGETGGDIYDSTDYIDPSLNPSGISNSENLDTKVTSSAINATANIINNPTGNAEEKKQTEQLKKLNLTTKQINDQSSCIASIGRLIIKMLVQKLTQSTVDWIKSGFDGKPAFLQDPGKFFNNIARTEILQFGAEINNPELFPFGKAWMQNTAAAFNNKFQDNARYSLDKEIQNTNPEWNAATFKADFSQGGWNAWTAMTQSPANNPIGFKIMADNEIQKRLEGTTQSTANQVHEALSQANGFLGDERCTDPVGVTRTEHQAALIEGRGIIRNGKRVDARLCNNWEYVTPGSMVAEAATSVMHYQNNAYLNVEDLNDAVAAITDALLAHYSQNIYDRGFANIGTEGADGSLYYDPSGINSGTTYASQTQKDFMPSQLSSSWLQANPDFDIRKDLTQALIDEQRTYSDKLALQNKELLSTTDGYPYNHEKKLEKTCPVNYTGTWPNCRGSLLTKPWLACPSDYTGDWPLCVATQTTNDNSPTTNAYGLIPTIYQLDYCIPGPHPGWEEDSRVALEKTRTPEVAVKSDKTASTIKGIVGVGLNFFPTVGPVLSSLFGALTGDDEAKGISTETRKNYSFKFFGLTGYFPRVRYDFGSDPVEVNLSSSEGLFQVMNRMLDKYIEIMNKTYFSNPDMLPTITKEAAREYNKLIGYGQIMEDNKNKMLSLKTTVNILGEIKDAVDKLNTDYPDRGDEYETQLKTQINAFGRLSAEMVNGDDIASADELAKQIVDKKNYIYKNLLKGPYGCEAFLEKKENIINFPSAGGVVKEAGNDWKNFNVLSVKRMTYPPELPIIYDYNLFGKDTVLPDPWNSKYVNNKMPLENKYSDYGPGFLSFVYLTQGAADTDQREGSERMGIGDIVDTRDAGQLCNGAICVMIINSKYVSLGERKPDGEARSGLFEHTINVY